MAEAGTKEVNSPGSSGENAERKIGLLDICAIVLAVALPNVGLVAVCSALPHTYGLKVFNAVAPAAMSQLGDAAMSLAAFLCMVLYVLNWTSWDAPLRQGLALSVPWLVACAGSLLKGRKYTWGPMIMVLIHAPLLLLLLRNLRSKPSIKWKHFSVAVALAALTAAVVLGAGWLLWVFDGGNRYNQVLLRDWTESYAGAYEVYTIKSENRTLDFNLDCGAVPTGSSTEERADVKAACSNANTMYFLIWSCPLIGSFSNLLGAVFMFMTTMTNEAENGSTDAQMKKSESILKRFVLFLMILVMGMYCSVSFAGISVRIASTLMAFFVVFLAMNVCWLLLRMKDITDHMPDSDANQQTPTQAVVGGDLEKEAINKGALEKKNQGLSRSFTTLVLKRSKFAAALWKLKDWDWAQAVVVGGVNVLLPTFFLLDWARQRLLGCRLGGREDTFTEFGRAAYDVLKKWHWVSILCKICLLGELFFTFQVGVSKATSVFLSWLNYQFTWQIAEGNLSFGLVVAIIFCIGYIMFLLPPVPGVPVYVFCGVVVAEQGRQIESIGQVGGCAIAVLLAFFLKLFACCGQYGIGYFLGKSLKVQQLIGVDKVFTRAIEKILKTKGLSLAKVAVLVGGPDWPVSVTCGILKMNLVQMLIGTCPVIVVLSPCVLAGAFLARVTVGEESIWSLLAAGFMGLSVFGQMTSMGVAVYCVTQVVDKDHEELEKERPEHKAVADLTRAEKDYVDTYEKVTQWDAPDGQGLGCLAKATILSASACMLSSGMLFAFMDTSCFENFGVSSKIGDDINENGLSNDVTNIIKPLGYVGLAIFAVGVLLHVAFVKAMEMKASMALRNDPKHKSDSPGPQQDGHAAGTRPDVTV